MTEHTVPYYSVQVCTCTCTCSTTLLKQTSWGPYTKRTLHNVRRLKASPKLSNFLRKFVKKRVVSAFPMGVWWSLEPARAKWAWIIYVRILSHLPTATGQKGFSWHLNTVHYRQTLQGVTAHLWWDSTALHCTALHCTECSTAYSTASD